jgi:tRNA A-37 threonylcarbamoyl transferase component Bud32
MNTHRLCPVCARPFDQNAPQGLCPECLLKAGFPSGTESEAVPNTSGFSPPTIAELAPHFPQLEIIECIGRGGMGAVYKARQPSLDRVVALKILRPKMADDPGFAERFTREARALAKLSHPNIVAVHDFGQSGGFHYFIMEFVDGANLRHLLNTAKISPHEALAIVPPICDALQFAHDQGVVHRDIKPENILLGKDGKVKIADFGLAKLVGTGAKAQAITSANDVMGTPYYMAPEQVERPQTVDHRADIYSLGVVFYQMLTGELPLGRFGPPSHRVRIDVRLDDVVLRALAKEPELRYQQASVLKTEVESIAATGEAERAANTRIEGEPGGVPTKEAGLPPGSAEAGRPAAETRRRFDWSPAVIWLSLLVACVAFVALYLGRRPSTRIKPGAVATNGIGTDVTGGSVTSGSFPDERNAQILRLRREQAERDLLVAGQKYKAGLINETAVFDAQQSVEMARALEANDRVRFARAGVAIWEHRLAALEAQYRAGLVEQGEVDAARTGSQIAKARLSEAERNPPSNAAADLAEVPFVLGPQKFADGDAIVIQQVRSTSPKLDIGDKVVVRGRYQLKSRDRAMVGMSLTQIGGDGYPESVLPAQWTEIRTGSGVFELSYEVKHAGALHLAFSSISEGKSFGTVYFGTPPQMARVANMSIVDFE